ncbi:MAG: hypothetical protein ACI89D_001862, partial [Bermanella sp.]
MLLTGSLEVLAMISSAFFTDEPLSPPKLLA